MRVQKCGLGHMLAWSLILREAPLHAQVGDPVEFIIDETFQVAGVGVVVAGTVKRGTLVQGASLLLGPHAGDASFKLTAIKSIAYKRLPVTKVLLPIFPSRVICVCCLAQFFGRPIVGNCLAATGGCWTDCCPCVEAGQTFFSEEGKEWLWYRKHVLLCVLSAHNVMQGVLVQMLSVRGAGHGAGGSILTSKGVLGI
jgi:hypothetical protein